PFSASPDVAAGCLQIPPHAHALASGSGLAPPLPQGTSTPKQLPILWVQELFPCPFLASDKWVSANKPACRSLSKILTRAYFLTSKQRIQSKTNTRTH